MLVVSTFWVVLLPALTDGTMASRTTLPDGTVTITSMVVPAVTVSVYFPLVSGFVLAPDAVTVSVVKSVMVAAWACALNRRAYNDSFTSNNFALVSAGSEIVPVITAVFADSIDTVTVGLPPQPQQSDK